MISQVSSAHLPFNAAWRLQGLRGAKHLARLKGVQGFEFEPIPESELRQQMQTSAAARQLPADITPVHVPRTTRGACTVCDSDIESDDLRMLCCARCGVIVHPTCYGVQKHTPGAAWLCEPCEAGIKSAPTCSLCPVLGGAMRFCKGGEWVHAACALWIPGVLVAPGQLPDISPVRAHACCFKTGCRCDRSATEFGCARR
jgi:hypothetical protein